MTQCTKCHLNAIEGEEICMSHLLEPFGPRKSKKELKAEAVRKHNAKFDYDKANPKTSAEIIREALLEVVGSIK